VDCGELVACVVGHQDEFVPVELPDTIARCRACVVGDSDQDAAADLVRQLTQELVGFLGLAKTQPVDQVIDQQQPWPRGYRLRESSPHRMSAHSATPSRSSASATRRRRSRLPSHRPADN
jgi:hypothetical protein